MTRRPLALVAVLAAGALLGGCSLVVSDVTPTATPTSTASDSTLVDTRLEVPSDLTGGPFDSARTVQAPRGWTVSVWARTDDPRLAVWTPDGRMLVSRPRSGDVLIYTPQKSGAPKVATLVDGLNQPHGLAFRGSTLYVAESDRVDSYRYADGAVGARATVLDGLPDAKSPELGGSYAHALKSVAVAKDGRVYVSVGSTGNTSEEDRSADPQRASILTVAPGASTASVFARGVRNGTGLAIAPDGSVWTAVNDRDQTPYPYDEDVDGDGSSDRGKVITAYVNDHPLEIVARLTEGRDLGWPFCNPDPDVTPGDPGTVLDYSDRPFVRDQNTNADGGKLDCAALPAVEQGLPAHSAPLGMAFADLAGLGEGALIGVHGSWNRNPPQAPQVWFLPWKDGALQDPEPFLTGFQDADGSRWGRTVAAVKGPDGAVYVTDDEAGAIYRMSPSS